MWKNSHVVMLPTQSKAVRLGQLVIGAGNNLFSSRKSNNIGSLTAYELYITSDEEIEEGDWCYNSKRKSIESGKYMIGTNEFIFYKKIIATTNTSLYIEDLQDKLCGQLLPQPSIQFIEKYIEEYNKGNVITKVMVEYEDSHTSQSKTPYLKINPDYTINIKPIKDSWSREEVITIIYNVTHQKGITCIGVDFDKWIKENL